MKALTHTYVTCLQTFSWDDFEQRLSSILRGDSKIKISRITITCTDVFSISRKTTFLPQRSVRQKLIIISTVD